MGYHQKKWVSSAHLSGLVLRVINYNADLYRKADVLPVNREITVEQAILLAKTQGYRIRAAS